MPDAYSPRLDDAVLLAMQSFRGVTRKGTDIPYLTHLLHVMVLVGEYGGDEDQMIGAVLHDWLEDIEGADLNALSERFGPRVAGYVRALSDSDTHPKPPWKERKHAYIAHLQHEAHDLKLISAADKLHNCMSIRRDHAEIGPRIWERFSGGRRGTLWYYDAVTIALGVGWDHALHRRLRAEVDGLLADAEAEAGAGLESS